MEENSIQQFENDCNHGASRFPAIELFVSRYFVITRQSKLNVGQSTASLFIARFALKEVINLVFVQFRRFPNAIFSDKFYSTRNFNIFHVLEHRFNGNK